MIGYYWMTKMDKAQDLGWSFYQWCQDQAVHKTLHQRNKACQCLVYMSMYVAWNIFTHHFNVFTIIFHIFPKIKLRGLPESVSLTLLCMQVGFFFSKKTFYSYSNCKTMSCEVTQHVFPIHTKNLECTTDLPQVTDKLYHIKLYQVHITWVGFKLTTIVVIGTDCTGWCKQPYDNDHDHDGPHKKLKWQQRTIYVPFWFNLFLVHVYVYEKNLILFYKEL
jgi:hypothetical protein